MTFDSPTKKNPTPASTPTGLAARLAARQAWAQRSVSPWVQFAQTVINRRPQVAPGQRPFALPPRPDRNTPLVLAGEAVSVDEPATDWLKAMPSFEEVRRSFEAARSERAQPAPGAVGPTQVQRQPSQAAGSSPSADSPKSLGQSHPHSEAIEIAPPRLRQSSAGADEMKVQPASAGFMAESLPRATSVAQTREDAIALPKPLSTFEKLRRSIETARTSEAPSGGASANQPPAQIQKSTFSTVEPQPPPSPKPSPRSRRVVSRIEEVTSRVKSEPPISEPVTPVVKSAPETDVETVQLAAESAEVELERVDSPALDLSSSRADSAPEPQLALTGKVIATADDSLMPRLDEASEPVSQTGQFTSQVEVSGAKNDLSGTVTPLQTSPLEVEPPISAPNLAEGSEAKSSEPSEDAKPLPLRQPTKNLAQTAAEPPLKAPEFGEDKPGPEPMTQIVQPATRSRSVPQLGLEKPVQPGEAHPTPAEPLETSGIELPPAEPDVGPAKEHFEISVEKLESRIHSGLQLPTAKVETESHSEFQQQPVRQETRSPGQEATDQPHPQPVQREPEALRSGKSHIKQGADLDLGQDIVSKATAALKTPLLTLPVASRSQITSPPLPAPMPTLPGLSEIMPSSGTDGPDSGSITGSGLVSRQIKQQHTGGTIQPASKRLNRSTQPLPLAVRPVQPHPLIDRPKLEPVREPPARPATPGSPGLQRQVASTGVGAAAVEPDAEAAEKMVDQGVSHLADQAAGETENLDQLAREIYPLIKQMLAVERERNAFC